MFRPAGVITYAPDHSSSTAVYAGPHLADRQFAWCWMCVRPKHIVSPTASPAAGTLGTLWHRIAAPGVLLEQMHGW